MTDKAMREHIRATLRIDFDADATLSTEQQAEEIRSDLTQRLCNLPSVLPVEATAIEVLKVEAEAEIYGHAEPAAPEPRETLYQAASRLVSQNVYYCVSGLVHGLTQHVHELSGDAQRAIGFTEDDDALTLWQRKPDADDFRDLAPDELKVAQDDDSWKYKIGEGMWSPPFGDELTAYQNAFDDLELEHPSGAEIYEHWLVSDWLADRLEERGETVARDVLGGLTIWARPTTGQAIAIDGVIEDIARAYFMEKAEG